MRKTFFIFFIFIMIILKLSSFGLADDYNIIAENKYLILSLNENTTEIKVEDKRGGNVWYSNPPERDSREKIAAGSIKNKLGSQLGISYYDHRDRYIRKDNYNHSIEYDQYSIIKSEIDNGVKIEYTLGQKWLEEDIVPLIINEEKFNQLIEKFEKEKEDDINFIKDCYSSIKLEKINEKEEEQNEQIDIYGVDNEKLFKDFLPKTAKGINETEKVMTNLLDLMVDNREDISKREDITHEDIDYLKESRVYVLKDLASWDHADLVELISSNYKFQEMQKVHYESNLDTKKPAVEIFTIPIIYYLDKDSLVVKIPAEEIEYPINVKPRRAEMGGAGYQVESIFTENQTHNFPLHSISLLEFFGAAHTGESGYIFVPDGSGALINLNNGKTFASRYNQPVFGYDKAIDLRENRNTFGEKIHLPVFGLKKDNEAFLAIIEEGETFARINANIAGKENSYNEVYPSFTTLPRGTTTIGGGGGDDQEFGSEIGVFQNEISQGNFQVRYIFMPEKKANYVGMAKYYRNYLQEKYDLRNRKINNNFFLEVVGAITETKPVFGISQETSTSLTTYKQLKQIVEKIQKEIILEDIALIYSGWLNKGLQHEFPNKINLDNSLGTKREFEKLIDFFKKENINFYPEVSFQYIYRNNFRDGFNPSSHASRFINNNIAYKYDYNLMTQEINEDTLNYILSPGYLNKLVNEFINDSSNYKLEGLTLSYMGNDLNSDYREEKQINRQETLKIVEQVMNKINSKFNTLVRGANIYNLPYTKNIIDVPMSSSGYSIFDRDIPFLQIVLSGLVNHSGQPLNLSPKYNDLLLKCIETGASPYFKINYENSKLTKNTEYNYLYSTSFNNWEEDIIETFLEFQDIFNNLQNQKIKDHEKLAENVYKTTYENGTAYIVNYNENVVFINDTRIEGKSYKKTENK